ncbi:SDR family NAD(P)-dependent oxidoreductase [Streptomyces sp. INA 01156]
MRLENKVALITGGTGGMGRATVRLFAKEGATAQIAARHEDRGDQLVAEINVTGTLRGVQTCAPLMKDSGGGSTVSIGSVA